HPSVSPSHHVAGAGDIDLGFIIPPRDSAGVVHFKQFRVQRPSVELKDQLRDFWSNSQHFHNSFFCRIVRSRPAKVTSPRGLIETPFDRSLMRAKGLASSDQELRAK